MNPPVPIKHIAISALTPDVFVTLITPADEEVTVKVLVPAPVAVAIAVAVKLLFCGDAKIENVV